MKRETVCAMVCVCVCVSHAHATHTRAQRSNIYNYIRNPATEPEISFRAKGLVILIHFGAVGCFLVLVNQIRLPISCGVQAALQRRSL